MKRFRLILLTTAAAAFLSGCVLFSVAPFYTANDLLFDAGLLGDWNQADNAGQHWKFEKMGERAYKLTVVEDGKPTVMEAHLFKLREQFFLDLAEDPQYQDKKREEEFPPRIPSHLLLRVHQMKPSVRLSTLGYKWMVEFLDKEPKALRHQIFKQGETVDGRELVLTASTEELQQFIIKHLDTEAAWKDQFELMRPPAPAKAEEKPAK